MKKENSPNIESERLLLRQFNVDDIDDILEMHSDRQVNKFLPWLIIKTKEEAINFYKTNILSEYSKEIAYTYAIVLKETNKVVGYINIHDIGGANDLGYGINRNFWHQAIATEAAEMLVAHLREVKFPYITATHDVLNDNSGKVMQKIGMKYCYTYQELMQPKNYLVHFRMYQLNLDGNNERVYKNYWEKYEPHFIETIK